MSNAPSCEALGKIRTKKSVSGLVNGLLTTAVKQFDPGPDGPVLGRNTSG